MRMSFGTITERARAAEQAGFDGIALMDHFAPPALPSADSFDAMTTAAAIAARTTRLKISHLVLCSSFRHPCVLAKEMVSLDHLSGGRFELGIGWGSVPGELERFGLPVEDPARRSARLEEYLQLFAALFTGQPGQPGPGEPGQPGPGEPGQPGRPVDFDGDFVTLRGAQLSPLPLAGRIPVVIGGGGARLTMPLVARYADWWNCPGYAFHRFDDLRPLAGRARISTQHPVGLAATAADVPTVTALTQRRFGGWGGLITGTAADVAGTLADLRERGVERFYLQFSDFGTPGTLARFGTDVIPRLRAAARPEVPERDDISF
jgi:alkanesulfonate monooxygenase SsuD/methylene tetrahydromethanopterin reductase-like flavin-dependent oxidoreductase (luciferase family)